MPTANMQVIAEINLGNITSKYVTFGFSAFVNAIGRHRGECKVLMNGEFVTGLELDFSEPYRTAKESISLMKLMENPPETIHLQVIADVPLSENTFPQLWVREVD